MENESHNLAFTAHYDGVDVGCGVIDNGSGTALLLGMSKDLKEALKTMTCHSSFDAEERGLWGTNYYVAILREV